MTEEGSEEIYRRMAAETFNATWGYMDKELRDQAENDMMVHAAHASRFLWGKVGSPLEFERGDWLLSRVYAKLGKGTEALHYAKHCLNTCLENEIGDFDLVFAHEAMARAYAVLEDWDRSETYLEQGRAVVGGVAKDEDRKYTISELESVPRRPAEGQ
jgi:hypothetical protein